MSRVLFSPHTPLMIGPFLKAAKRLKAPDPIEVAFNVGIRQYGRMGLMVGLTEKRFIRRQRPFFNVYPGVLSALSRTSLSIKPESIPRSVIHELGVVAIKFPLGCEIAKTTGVNAFMLSVVDQTNIDNINAAGFGDLFNTRNRPCVVITSTFGHSTDTHGQMSCSACSMENTFDGIPEDSLPQDVRSTLNFFARIGLGVMMLAADPEFIKPVTLQSDDRKGMTVEERIARAKKRGVFGFTIGEDDERSPHFRRPHFAIRWTGKGASVPKLVPVKGSVVGKKAMTEVPTGYESRDSTDGDIA